MDYKYNPSAYAKTGYQALLREKEKGKRNGIWVFGEKDTSKNTEMVLEVSIKAGFPI
ncbi:MAG: hypothetical protein PHQ22_06585 [Sulfuricurvum sp.]|nr:hypothetical protein [Sulfuricurvum sp.]MDD5386844.1 hypothetical protein [Sulfuricurvum sp.]